MKRTGRATLLLVFLAVLGTSLTEQPVFGQSSEDVRAVMRVETAGQPAMDMEYSLGQEQMRLDMPPDVSVVSTTGDNPSMLMIQHPEQRYIEWGPQQLEMMQQMLQGMSGGSGNAGDLFDPATLQFEETGQTGQVGPWDAFEVVMQGPDGQEGALWLTTDAEIGLFELSMRAAEAASMLQNPMTGGGGGSSQTF